MIPDTMEVSDTDQLQGLCNKLESRDHWDYDEPVTLAQAHEILGWLLRISKRLDKLERNIHDR